ncbi:hypothetical protein P154DRAFT_535250 [Amniculicola lignicola CBS 123094]|uniref:Transcription initiation factor TFIID subunit 8 n=1 Tax=Amniculicola lignicola CBS 123094 TaxID=1392246 RepID=A0A6A5WE69_9PLEO|nr:hypothetical protein P154DRAFT_535250 [Amniculicola lignicola CBS 123094]
MFGRVGARRASHTVPEAVAGRYSQACLSECDIPMDTERSSTIVRRSICIDSLAHAVLRAHRAQWQHIRRTPRLPAVTRTRTRSIPDTPAALLPPSPATFPRPAPDLHHERPLRTTPAGAQPMPGLISPSSDASAGPTVTMKRAREQPAASSLGEPHVKKRRVLHKLNKTQPVQTIRDPINAELDIGGLSQDFIDRQLKRAIAIQCKGIGYDSARPDALEAMRGMVHEFMSNFTSQVRSSMVSARRTESVSHDWVCALLSSGITGSSSLEPHLDTGNLPGEFLQPPLPSPQRPDTPPPEIDGLLGPELSGRRDKEERKWIPANFPAFPGKYTYKATPVFVQRETDPRKIREKATEYGIEAEKSLRKLMAAQKRGLQGNKVKKPRLSKRILGSDELWKKAMDEQIKQEEERLRLVNEKRERDRQDDIDNGFDPPPDEPVQEPRKIINLEETPRVNYDRRFWRMSAREGGAGH